MESIESEIEDQWRNRIDYRPVSVPLAASGRLHQFDQWSITSPDQTRSDDINDQLDFASKLLTIYLSARNDDQVENGNIGREREREGNSNRVSWRISIRCVPNRMPPFCFDSDSVTVDRWMNGGPGWHTCVRVRMLLDWSHKGHSTFLFSLSRPFPSLPFVLSFSFSLSVPAFCSSVSMHCRPMKWIEHGLFSIDCSERCSHRRVCIHFYFKLTGTERVWQ